MFHVEHPKFITLQVCPLCGADKLEKHLVVKDHSCSQLDFQLDKCQACDFVFTNPRPAEEENGAYYKFADYISHTNSSKGLIGTIYRQVRKINLKRKLAVLEKHKSGKKVLDVGCGTGFFPAFIQTKGYTVTGVEPDDDARKYATEQNKVQAYPLDQLNHFSQGEFDCITMWHVLEHVYHLQEQVKILSKLIKPGGLFVIALPNYKSFDAQHYGKFWAGYDVPRHLYHFEEKTIAKLIEDHGFKKIDTVPMKFDAGYVAVLSQKHKGEPSSFIAYKIGRKSNQLAAQGKYPYSSQIYVFKNKQ